MDLFDSLRALPRLQLPPANLRRPEDGVVSGPESPTLDEDDDHITGVAMRKGK